MKDIELVSLSGRISANESISVITETIRANSISRLETPDDSVDFSEVEINNNAVDNSGEISVLSNDFDDKDDQYYPEGGLEAYLVMFGSFCGAITSLGMINSIGAVQAYVSNHQLMNLKATTVSWIFSIYLAICYSVGIIIGPIFDYKGARGLIIVATALTFIGLMAAANSTEIYQFILSFICLGLGNGIALTPLIGVTNHWFLRRRGFMTGIVTSGGSVGGLSMPLILRHAFKVYDYVWAIRIIAFYCLALMLIACFLVKARIFRTKVPQEKTKFLIADTTKKVMAILKKHSDITFVFTGMGAFCLELSLVLFLTYFVTYAMAQGFSESTGYLLLTTWNTTSIVGRLIPSLGSDFIGKYNVNILMTSAYNLCIFVILLAFGYKLSALYAFAGIGGFFSGSILGLIPACLAQITKVSEFGERYGILNFIISFGNLVGIPIGAAVIDDGSIKNYNYLIVLIGCLSTLGTLFFYIARFTMVGFKLNAKV